MGGAAGKQKVIQRMDTQLPALINRAFTAIERQVEKNRGKDS